MSRKPSPEPQFNSHLGDEGRGAVTAPSFPFFPVNIIENACHTRTCRCHPRYMIKGAGKKATVRACHLPTCTPGLSTIVFREKVIKEAHALCVHVAKYSNPTNLANSSCSFLFWMKFEIRVWRVFGTKGDQGERCRARNRQQERGGRVSISFVSLPSRVARTSENIAERSDFLHELSDLWADPHTHNPPINPHGT